jgi:hypothetical protein
VFVTYFFVLVNLVEEGNSLRNNSDFDYPMDVKVAVSFTIITAFLALPLYVAIMMLCCFKFGVEKRFLRGLLSVLVVLTFAMFMVRIRVGLTDIPTELKENIVLHSLISLTNNILFAKIHSAPQRHGTVTFATSITVASLPLRRSCCGSSLGFAFC